MRTVTCQACGQDFEAKRSTAKFCSDRCRFHSHIARTKRVAIPADLRFSILLRDEFRCRYCGDTPERKHLHVDHIQSVKDGGALTDPDNLVTACRVCNEGKGERSVDPEIIP